MMYVFLGKQIAHNITVTKCLNQLNLSYELLSYSEFDQSILEFCMSHTSDCFSFLTNRMKPYQKRIDMSYRELCQLILSDVTQTIQFPLIIKDDVVYAGITNEELCSLLLPRKIRLMLNRHYRLQIECLDMKKVRICG